MSNDLIEIGIELHPDLDPRGELPPERILAPGVPRVGDVIWDLEYNGWVVREVIWAATDDEEPDVVHILLRVAPEHSNPEPPYNMLGGVKVIPFDAREPQPTIPPDVLADAMLVYQEEKRKIVDDEGYDTSRS